MSFFCPKRPVAILLAAGMFSTSAYAQFSSSISVERTGVADTYYAKSVQVREEKMGDILQYYSNSEWAEDVATTQIERFGNQSATYRGYNVSTGHNRELRGPSCPGSRYSQWYSNITGFNKGNSDETLYFTTNNWSNSTRPKGGCANTDNTGSYEHDSVGPTGSSTMQSWGGSISYPFSSYGNLGFRCKTTVNVPPTDEFNDFGVKVGHHWSTQKRTFNVPLRVTLSTNNPERAWYKFDIVQFAVDPATWTVSQAPTRTTFRSVYMGDNQAVPISPIEPSVSGDYCFAYGILMSGSSPRLLSKQIRKENRKHKKKRTTFRVASTLSVVPPTVFMAIYGSYHGLPFYPNPTLVYPLDEQPLVESIGGALDAFILSTQEQRVAKCLALNASASYSDCLDAVTNEAIAKFYPKPSASPSPSPVP